MLLVISRGLAPEFESNWIQEGIRSFSAAIWAELTGSSLTKDLLIYYRDDSSTLADLRIKNLFDQIDHNSSNGALSKFLVVQKALRLQLSEMYSANKRPFFLQKGIIQSGESRRFLFDLIGYYLTDIHGNDDKNKGLQRILHHLLELEDPLEHPELIFSISAKIVEELLLWPDVSWILPAYSRRERKSLELLLEHLHRFIKISPSTDLSIRFLLLRDHVRKALTTKIGHPTAKKKQSEYISKYVKKGTVLPRDKKQLISALQKIEKQHVWEDPEEIKERYSYLMHYFGVHRQLPHANGANFLLLTIKLKQLDAKDRLGFSDQEDFLPILKVGKENFPALKAYVPEESSSKTGKEGTADDFSSERSDPDKNKG